MSECEEEEEESLSSNLTTKWKLVTLINEINKILTFSTEEVL